MHSQFEVLVMLQSVTEDTNTEQAIVVDKYDLLAHLKSIVKSEICHVSVVQVVAVVV